jgi:hypothetical protein
MRIRFQSGSEYPDFGFGFAIFPTARELHLVVLCWVCSWKVIQR